MNWKALIEGLINAGMTQRQIAEQVGCTQPCIAKLASGQRGDRLSYEIGSRLVRLSVRVRRSLRRAKHSSSPVGCSTP